MGEGTRPFILRDNRGRYITYLKGEVILYEHQLYEVTRDVFGRLPTNSDYFRPLTTSNYIASFNGQTGEVSGVSSFNGQTGEVVGISSINGETGDYTDDSVYTGILYGGVITADIGGNTFDVSAGYGQIATLNVDSDGEFITRQVIDWNAFRGLTLQHIASSDFTRIYIDSDGNINQQTPPFEHEDYIDKIILGTISHIDRSTIALVTNKQYTAYQLGHKFLDLVNVFGPIKKQGLVVSANGTNLSLNRASGQAFIIGSDYENDSVEPDLKEISGITSASIARIYRDGSGDFVYDTNSLSFYSVVDPAQYDDGSGTLQTVNNNQWTIQRLYMFPNLQNVIMSYYGRVVYNAYEDALVGIQDEVFTESEITSENAIFLGFLIVRGGAADLTDNTDGKILQSGFCRSVPVGGGAAGGGIIGDYVYSVNGQTGDVIISVTGGGGITYYAGQGLTLNGTTFSELGWQRGGETFPETVGGVEAGTSFENGTTAIEILETLLFPYQPVSFTSFGLGLSTTIFEVGETGGNVTRAASWTTDGPNDNWVAGSLSIDANGGIGNIASGLNYDGSPHIITYDPYNYTNETTVTFTISGQQDQGSDPTRNTYLYWRYRYFSGKTGAGFDGTGFTSQGFDSTLTRTSPNNWTVTFPAASPANKAYFIIPENEFSGSLTFTDTGTSSNFPFDDGGTFDHVNSHGLNVVYHIFESTNDFGGEVSIRVNT